MDKDLTITICFALFMLVMAHIMLPTVLFGVGALVTIVLSAFLLVVLQEYHKGTHNKETPTYYA